MNGIKQLFMPKDRLQSKARIEYIDFLKILAAFFTVFYHFAYYKLNYGFNATQSFYFPNANRIIMCFAACCVPIFFMVNGTLLFSKKCSWQNVYKKAIKILFLTVVWTLFDFPSWFFKTLFILYILFPFFQHLYEKKIKIYYLIILMLLVFPFGYNAAILLAKLLLSNKTVYILGQTIDLKQLRVTGFFTMYSIAYFLLGPILAKLKVRTIYGVTTMIIGLGMIVFECVSYTIMDGAMYDGVNAAFPTYGAMALSIGVFVTAKNVVKTANKLTEIVRDQILAIYLLHMAVMHIIGNVWGAIDINLPMAIIGTFIILFLCVGVGKIASRIPVLCCFFRI